MRSPWTILAGLPGPVRLIIAGTFVNRLGTFIMPFLAVVLRRDMHLTPGQSGLLMGALGFGALCSVLAGGWLTDALGRKRTLVISLIGSGALAMVMSGVRSLPVWATLLIGYGFLVDLYRPAASSVLGDLLPPQDRAVGFAALRMSLNLGFAIGTTLGGLIADWHWQLLFLGDGFTTFAYGIIIVLFLAETRSPHHDPEAARGLSPWRDVVFLQLIFASFVFSLMFFLDFTVFPLTVTNAGYPAVVFGALIGANGLLIAIFEISLVDAMRSFRRLKLAAWGSLSTGVGLAMLALGSHWSLFLVAVVVWTLGEILAAPQQSAFVTDWAPPAARGRYMASYQASWILASAVNPPIFIPLHARWGDQLFWPVMLGICLIPAAMLWRLDRMDRPENLRGAH